MNALPQIAPRTINNIQYRNSIYKKSPLIKGAK
ncbi:MAG: hypothetical protein NT02SARS_1004 [SAR86 cluster bacterium SAR86B]|uniref:Uncharacterized protein n=1 Tax=SAR86 cluster bacterium SAR86B TaxID=1123867 RepID=J5KJ66_9GAMM|nr:MAG: hypothetical protein NT02SARS_1004 [SAR86 cluster bacterium SAR86B]